MARTLGREPLPVFSNPHLKPESFLFAAFNRHYVWPELRRALEDVAEQMQTRYHGSVVWYLDANFPFIDGYPLEPHFSQKDGKKVDLAFYWNDAKTGKPAQNVPSPFGYGVCVEPLPGEYHYAADCEGKGFWYISLAQTLADPFFNKENYAFDKEKTRELARLLAESCRRESPDSAAFGKTPGAGTLRQIPTASCKFFNVYGPNEYHKGRMASVIFHTFRQIKQTGGMKLFKSHKSEYADGHQSRDFIYVKDVLDIILFFMKNQSADSGIYNFGTGQARTFLDLTQSTFKALNLDPNIMYIDTRIDIRDTYQYFTEAKMDKLRAAGYDKSLWSLEDGVNDYVTHYLNKAKYY